MRYPKLATHTLVAPDYASAAPVRHLSTITYLDELHLSPKAHNALQYHHAHDLIIAARRGNLSDISDMQPRFITEVREAVERGGFILRETPQSLALRSLMKDLGFFHEPVPTREYESWHCFTTADINEAIGILQLNLLPRQHTLIARRYGLDCHPPMTLTQCGEYLSIGRQRACTIRDDAFLRLSRSLAARQLRYIYTGENRQRLLAHATANVTTCHRLIDAGINTVQQLADHSRTAIHNIPSLTDTDFRNIDHMLDQYGLRFNEHVEPLPESTSVDELLIHPNTRKALRQSGFHTVRDLLPHARASFFRYFNLRKWQVDEVIRDLRRHDLFLVPDPYTPIEDLDLTECEIDRLHHAEIHSVQQLIQSDLSTTKLRQTEIRHVRELIAEYISAAN